MQNVLALSTVPNSEGVEATSLSRSVDDEDRALSIWKHAGVVKIRLEIGYRRQDFGRFAAPR